MDPWWADSILIDTQAILAPGITSVPSNVFTLHHIGNSVNHMDIGNYILDIGNWKIAYWILDYTYWILEIAHWLLDNA